MKQIGLSVILLLAFSVLCFSQSNQTESVVISTYYPSPYGVYATLRLFPDSEPVDPLMRESGTLYVDSNEGKLYLFNGTSEAWEKAGGESYWNSTGNDIYTLYPVGIGQGTVSAGNTLEVNGTINAVGDVCIASGQCLSQLP